LPIGSLLEPLEPAMDKLQFTLPRELLLSLVHLSASVPLFPMLTSLATHDDPARNPFGRFNPFFV
jgi:hypothetical protein